jgi:hypothetical protein
MKSNRYFYKDLKMKIQSWIGDIGGMTMHGNEYHTTPYLPSTAFSGLTKITVGAIPPDNPQEGDIWIDTNE